MLIVAAVLRQAWWMSSIMCDADGRPLSGFPAQPRGVLRHFHLDVATPALAALPAQTVRPLQGRDRSFSIVVGIFSSPLPPRLYYAIGNHQYARGVNVQFVLRRAWQGDIHRYAPWLLAFQIG